MDAKKRPKQLNSPLIKQGMKYSSKAVAWTDRDIPVFILKPR